MTYCLTLAEYSICCWHQNESGRANVVGSRGGCQSYSLGWRCRPVHVGPVVVWSGNGKNRATVQQAPVMVRNEGPLPVLRHVTAADVQTILLGCLRTLVSGGPLRTADHDLFKAHFGEVSAEEVHDRSLEGMGVEAALGNAGPRHCRRLRRAS
jgi:hypothetical protein